MALLINRKNMVGRREEAWRPPLFLRPDNASQKLLAVLRRLLDLQAGSIWRDLRVLLPQVRGAALDVGCGAQPFRPLFAPEAKYIAIDTVDSKAHFGYELPDVIYFAGDSWPVEDSSIDFVLCTETMERARSGSLAQRGIPLPHFGGNSRSNCAVRGPLAFYSL
jgi:hypothetical protein